MHGLILKLLNLIVSELGAIMQRLMPLNSPVILLLCNMICWRTFSIPPRLVLFQISSLSVLVAVKCGPNSLWVCGLNFITRTTFPIQKLFQAFKHEVRKKLNIVSFASCNNNWAECETGHGFTWLIGTSICQLSKITKSKVSVIESLTKKSSPFVPGNAYVDNPAVLLN